MKKALLTISIVFASSFAFAQLKNAKLLVGTYINSGSSEGIYIYDFNLQNASTVLTSLTKNIVNPSYLSFSPDKKYVYVVNEVDKIGSVSAFRFNPDQGKLTLINTVNSEGADPCHITADDQNVLVANYRGGSLAVFNRFKNGSITNAVQIIKHIGKSINKSSQTSAHVHMNQLVIPLLPVGKRAECHPNSLSRSSSFS